jgi:hypothetical protein
VNGGEPGAAAAQALRLLAGVQEWVRHDLGPHVATGAPECRYCPLCAAIVVLRGDRPEVTEKLVEAGSALLTALRAAFEPVPAGPGAGPADPAADHWADDPAEHRAGRRPGPGAARYRPAGPPAGSRVERIDLD